MATHDDHDPFANAETKTVRRAREHPTGIIIPRWWRGNVALVVAAIAVGSVILAVQSLDKAADRAADRAAEQKVEQAEAQKVIEQSEEANNWYRSTEPPSDLPLEAVARVFSTQEEGGAGLDQPDAETVRAYEEPLPGELYEESPVTVDASGPRIAIPEEYIPDSGFDSVGDDGPLDGATLSETDSTAGAEESTAVKPDQPEPLRTQNSVEDRMDGNRTDIDIKPFEHALLEQQQAWLDNAISFSPDLSGDAKQPTDAPMIAIVLDDMGVDLRRAPRAIALPGPLTLSFLTYARNLHDQTRAALASGHELMIHIPMEPSDSTVDPGPNALRVEDSVAKTLEHLEWGLAQFDGYVGLNNHMGSKFTQNTTGMRAVMEVVRDRGLLFLDSRTAPGSVAAELAQEIGIPFATRNVFLDHVDDEDEIRKRLAQTERLARKNGAVVAIGHPHDATLSVLEEWLPTVADKGFMLVPMSELVRRTWLNEN